MNEIWTRDQLLVAFNLYCKIPFSKTKANNPLVIEVARLTGRSPASVAMKLGNFGSFDPALQIKGIKGLSRASRADRGIWDEFNQSWDKLSIESELATERLRASPLIKPLEKDKVKRSSELYSWKLQDLLERPSEKFREVKVRLHQRFFREAVLASYGSCCCVCSNPVPQLLTAGHIIPWAEREDLRANPRNGLCCEKWPRKFEHADKWRICYRWWPSWAMKGSRRWQNERDGRTQRCSKLKSRWPR